MLEIVFLIVTTGGIAAYARGRGGNPWLWGTISVAGHLLIQFFGGFVLALLHRSSDPDANTVIFIASYAWVGVVAFGTRFLLGSGREKPSGMCSCSNCKYLNQRYAVICEACSQPFRRSEAAAPKL
jgi:hypothetical protein